MLTVTGSCFRISCGFLGAFFVYLNRQVVLFMRRPTALTRFLTKQWGPHAHAHPHTHRGVIALYAAWTTVILVADSLLRNPNHLHIQIQFLLMHLSFVLWTHQSHNTDRNSSEALTTFQPVIHSMGRFTYPLRFSSQGTLVFAIKRRQAAAVQSVLLHTRTEAVISVTSIRFFFLSASFWQNLMHPVNVCVFVCLLFQSIDLSRSSDTDHRHLHVSSGIRTVYGWRGWTVSHCLFILFSSILIVFL